jgi:hypothetical protein
LSSAWVPCEQASVADERAGPLIEVRIVNPMNGMLMNRMMALAGAATLAAGLAVAVAPSAQAGWCENNFGSEITYRTCVAMIGPKCEDGGMAAPECQIIANQVEDILEAQKCREQNPSAEMQKLNCSDPTAPAPEVIPEYVEPTWAPAPNS